MKQAICEETCRIVLRGYSTDLQPIVLASSMARDAATIEREADKLRLLGDADFLLVFNEGAREPSPALLEKATHEVEHAFVACGIPAHVGLNSVHRGYLRRLPPYIATYELRELQTVFGRNAGLSDLSNLTAAIVKGVSEPWNQ